MRRYEYTLKEPFYFDSDGKIIRISSVRWDKEPKYHIANDTVYVLVQASNKCGDIVGLPIYLPITMSVGDFNDSLLDWELIEEPKKCMFTKEEFTEEDRKILCEDCEEECEYAKKEESVSEDLEKAAVEAFKQIVDENRNSFLEIFKAGAQWMHKKMIHEFNLKEK